MDLGFDIGGTKIEAAVLNHEGDICHRQRTATPKNSYKDFLSTIDTLYQEVSSLFKCIDQIGFSMCGIVNHKRGEVWSANVPILNGKPIFDDLSLLLNKKVVIRNDCQSFALSEAIGGAADNFSHVLGLVLGTGLGGGYVVDKKIITGSNGIFSELGHFCISAALRDKYQLPLFTCGCGRKGCYEQYVSGTGLENIYRNISTEKLSAKEIIQKMRGDDDVSVQSFGIFTDILGTFLSDISWFFDPDAIVLGGGVSQVDELYPILENKILSGKLANTKAPKLLKPKYLDSSGVRGSVILTTG